MHAAAHDTIPLLSPAAGGTLDYLNWYGTTCDTCSGVSSPICIHQPGNAKVGEAPARVTLMI